MDPYEFISDSDSDTEFHGFSPWDIHNRDDTVVNDENDLSDISSILSTDSSDYDMSSEESECEELPDFKENPPNWTDHNLKHFQAPAANLQDGPKLHRIIQNWKSLNNVLKRCHDNTGGLIITSSPSNYRTQFSRISSCIFANENTCVVLQNLLSYKRFIRTEIRDNHIIFWLNFKHVSLPSFGYACSRQMKVTKCQKIKLYTV